jgi:four helix bundle protein
MQPAKSFRDLKVYQTTREAARSVFEYSRGFPHEERYSLTDQIRRSSRAVKAMIAERGRAAATRPLSSMRLMRLSGNLTKHNPGWMMLGWRIPVERKFEDMDKRYDAIGGMLSRMIDRAGDFCKHAPGTDYRSIAREQDSSPITDH